ncbi:hypothetical protein L6164_035249 [Bauhinia variegata]|uniref:Uncharacterized protein n=1 Tax=Bauhinia variegata TaxID=167791 RepID=A0ACB9KXJ9_BAUVA|nr:hypothetical protein L6164_035249 [Bauhinia variegata]
MKTPPSLLSLTIDSAVLNLSDISDLSPIPAHILRELFLVYLFLFLFNCLQIVCSLFFNFDFASRLVDASHSVCPYLCALLLLERILKAGKLTEKVLKLFVATGKDEVLSLIQELNIQHIVTPVLPTRCSEKY